MKMQLHYLQNTANGSLVVNETYQESNSKGTRYNLLEYLIKYVLGVFKIVDNPF